jgi:DNA-binding SARP family transcriptional activator
MDENVVTIGPNRLVAAAAENPPSPRPCGQLRIRLLGAFELSAGRRRFGIGGVAQRVVAILALADRSVSRCRIAQSIWPDASSSSANANLRSVLWRLAQVHPRIVECRPSELCLSDQVTSDTRELSKLAVVLLDRSTTLTEQQLSSALQAELHDDLLPEWGDEQWLQPERERFR